jgi:hypothetical protein
MASFPFASAGVKTSEIDLSTVVSSVASSPAAIAGLFRWGPGNTAVLVDQETTLAKTFGTPTNYNAETWFTAKSFLDYSNSLLVVRAVANDQYSAVATTNANPTSNAGVTVLNTDDYNNKIGGSLSGNSQVLFVARCPGALGNSLRVSICDSANAYAQANVFAQIAALSVNTSTISLSFNTGSNSAVWVTTANADANTISGILPKGTILQVGNSTLGYIDLKVNTTNVVGSNVNISFTNPYTLAANIVANSTTWATGSYILTKYWEFYKNVNKAPGTSPYVAARGGSGDEIHIVVQDANGQFSGNPNQILEVWSGLSRASDSQNVTGGQNFYQTVIKNNSQYLWWVNDRQASYTNTAANMVPVNTYALTMQLGAGSDGGSSEATIDLGTITSGYSYFLDPTLSISFLLAGKPIGGTGNTYSANWLIDNIAEVRKDLVVCISPDPSLVVNVKGSEALNLVGNRQNLRYSSYGVLDSGYKYTYDKYNGVYRYVPLNGDIAGAMAYTDQLRAPWWSPAGADRGQIKNVAKLAWNPSKPYRDLIYPADYNPVVTLPNVGTILDGDKTMIGTSSAFSRINVRRLFIVLEKAIAIFAQKSLFQFNDAITRQQFVNAVVPYLRDIKAQRGIYDFKVVCDETNNTAQVIDNNGFVGDIYIKPARSINYIQLNFVAVATSVEFNTVVGSF